MITYLALANLAVSVLSTVLFSCDADIYTIKDALMTMLCCVLPIIPLCYLYRWCNKFVRGEI
jgi:hypothetical protein